MLLCGISLPTICHFVSPRFLAPAPTSAYDIAIPRHLFVHAISRTINAWWSSGRDIQFFSPRSQAAHGFGQQVTDRGFEIPESRLDTYALSCCPATSSVRRFSTRFVASSNSPRPEAQVCLSTGSERGETSEDEVSTCHAFVTAASSFLFWNSRPQLKDCANQKYPSTAGTQANAKQLVPRSVASGRRPPVPFREPAWNSEREPA